MTITSNQNIVSTWNTYYFYTILLFIKNILILKKIKKLPIFKYLSLFNKYIHHLQIK
jgi:hypothetical protein